MKQQQEQQQRQRLQQRLVSNTSFNGTAPTGTPSTSELEVAWNPSQACIDLQRACQILTERCLKLSAKWAAEQWMGLPPEIIEGAIHIHVNAVHSGAASTSAAPAAALPAAPPATTTIPDDLFFGVEHHPAIHYARTLLELGEYAHAAAVLSETSLTNKAASVESMPPPLADLSPKAIYYRAYALYMAGERRKEEDVLELQRYGAMRDAMRYKICDITRLLA